MEPRMGKLVRTLSGQMIDLVLDIRQGSPWFGKIIARDMPCSAEQTYSEWIWVPPGFAHGNLFPAADHHRVFVLGEYSPGCEAGISPLSGDLDWSLCDPQCKAMFDRLAAGESLLISDKDRNGLTFTQWSVNPRRRTSYTASAERTQLPQLIPKSKIPKSPNPKS